MQNPNPQSPNPHPLLPSIQSLFDDIDNNNTITNNNPLTVLADVVNNTLPPIISDIPIIQTTPTTFQMFNPNLGRMVRPPIQKWQNLSLRLLNNKRDYIQQRRQFKMTFVRYRQNDSNSSDCPDLHIGLVSTKTMNNYKQSRPQFKQMANFAIQNPKSSVLLIKGLWPNCIAVIHTTLSKFPGIKCFDRILRSFISTFQFDDKRCFIRFSQKSLYRQDGMPDAQGYHLCIGNPYDGRWGLNDYSISVRYYPQTPKCQIYRDTKLVLDLDLSKNIFDNLVLIYSLLRHYHDTNTINFF